MEDLTDQLKDTHLNLGKEKDQFEDARANLTDTQVDGAGATGSTGQTGTHPNTGNPDRHENTGATPKVPRYQGTPDLNKTRGQSPIPNLHNLRHQAPHVPRPDVNMPPPGYTGPGTGNNPLGGGNGPNGPQGRTEDDPQETIRILRDQIRREAERAARAEFEAAQRMRNIQGMETKWEAMQNEWNRRESRLTQELDLLREKIKPKTESVVAQ
ncbi:hypothetical protein M569_17192, partial [Genlisea aurea]